MLMVFFFCFSFSGAISGCPFYLLGRTPPQEDATPIRARVVVLTTGFVFVLHIMYTLRFVLNFRNEVYVAILSIPTKEELHSTIKWYGFLDCISAYS